MFIYTVKVAIEQSIQQKLLTFYTTKHLQQVVDTGCFTGYSLEMDTDKNEIIVRYPCNSRELFNSYINYFSGKLRDDTINNFPTGILKIDRNFTEILTSTI